MSRSISRYSWLTALCILALIARAQAQSAVAPAQGPDESAPVVAQPQPEKWGFFTPGKGYTIADTRYGSMNIGGYVLLRYINQLPADH